ncbi:hypothetical protein [Amycolatopsis sp. CA-126428]|uniref:hypothetical protein n=1 Tax=Amycolatopsis sp. CA-126428 TaxID=2073158 RepID=UPI0018EB3E5A|nr:hypothetical protein [Amycolatopsis sp. CA-126428]
MTARFKDLALDANDHQALADWWCRDALTGDTRPEDGPVPIADPDPRGPLIWLNPVR